MSILRGGRRGEAPLTPPPGTLAAALEALAAPGKHLAAVSGLARRSRAFVYAFLFVAGDAPAMEELVTRFAGLTSLAEGAIVELPRPQATGNRLTP